MALAQLHATQALLAWSRLGQSLHRFSGRHHLFTIVASAAAMVSPATLVAEPEWRALLKAAVVELPQVGRERMLWCVQLYPASGCLARTLIFCSATLTGCCVFAGRSPSPS